MQQRGFWRRVQGGRYRHFYIAPTRDGKWRTACGKESRPWPEDTVQSMIAPLCPRCTKRFGKYVERPGPVETQIQEAEDG